jgi:hypothetical protein
MARTKKLKPAGHSAVIEALIQPAIFLGSTLMSAIAAYVLAEDFLKPILAGQGNGFDIFNVILSAGIGFLIDMAIIVSATRYRMHKLRGAESEEDVAFKQLAQRVLTVALTSETLTLLYFFYLQSPESFPSWVAGPLSLVHSFLVVFRAFLPPTIIAYFVAGVMPIVIERSDRNREVKSRTSQSIAVLIERLTEIKNATTPGEMLSVLGSLLALNSYAMDDTDDTLTAEGRSEKDEALLNRLADLHGLSLAALKATPTESPSMAAPAKVVPLARPVLPPEPGRARFDDETAARWDAALGMDTAEE